MTAARVDDEARARDRLRARRHPGGGGRGGHRQDDRARGAHRGARAQRARPRCARSRRSPSPRRPRPSCASASADTIDEVAAEHPDDARLVAARHEVDEAAICTLHAFAQRILVEHCVAAGIPPGFDVLDETAERADFDARFERFADSLLADPDGRARPRPGILDRA